MPPTSCLTAGAMSFTYDGNGNQLTKTTGSTTLNYSWDALNRLLSVVGGSTNTNYGYDGDGNRVVQQAPAGTYAYVNDVASALPSVLNENGPDGNVDYVYGLSTVSASSPAFEYFYQFDGLGSAINITDPTGAQKANYSYDPWGKMTLPLDPLGTKEKYKFTGEANDPNDGLVYLRARYYDTATGRFLSEDPLRTRLVYGESPYAYAGDSPPQLVDRSGLWYSWSQVGHAFGQSVKSVPSLFLCGGGVLDIGSSCQEQGLTPGEAAVGGDIGTVVITLATGGTGEAIISGIKDTVTGGTLIYKGIKGTLTPEDLLEASESALDQSLDLNIPDTGYYVINSKLIPEILAGPPIQLANSTAVISQAMSGKPTK